jgi:hypothetical protein
VIPPAPVNFTPLQLRLLAVLPLPPPRVVVSLEFIPTYYGNAPPSHFL